MRRALAALLLLLLAGALAFALARPSSPTGVVYTVAQVAAGMARHPRAWYGHTVTVRAKLVLVQWASMYDGSYTSTGQDGCTDPQDCSMGQDGCKDAQHCSLHVPTYTVLVLYLVGRVPHGKAATAHLRDELAAARHVQPATPGAP